MHQIEQTTLSVNHITLALLQWIKCLTKKTQKNTAKAALTMAMLRQLKATGAQVGPLLEITDLKDRVTHNGIKKI